MEENLKIVSSAILVKLTDNKVYQVNLTVDEYWEILKYIQLMKNTIPINSQVIEEIDLLNFNERKR